MKTLEDPAVDPIRAKKEILESPIYKDLILDADGQTTALLINLKRDPYFSEHNKKRNQLLTKKRSKQLSQREQDQLEKYMAEYEDYYVAFNNQRHQDIEKVRSIIRPYKKHAVVHLGGVP
ncbi:MAG: transporter, partial [Deltaproteobacteria bacterium]|nr:transporter [Deltaproteobacteria bacterium]